MLRRPTYALSIKQPWAALVVAGRKTIEVRKWATAIRGRVMIHAARLSDDRPEGWAAISDELRPLAELTGGVIGADLTSLHACATERWPEFAKDTERHLNDPSWFQAPRHVRLHVP